MTSSPLSLPDLPQVTWRGTAAASHYDEQAQRLSITARPGTDWSNDPLGGDRRSSAAALLFVPPDGDFALSARVQVGFTGPFDAAVLCLWQDEQQWAKLCFEHSPQREATIMSVVTNGISDDASAVVVGGDTTHLRVLRTGHAYAFHHSPDGVTWHFVRLFRLGQDHADMRAGFLVQAPNATGCTGTFEAIHLTRDVPSDLRSGD